MPKQNKMRTRRVKNLMVVCTLSAMLLAISTYAWFIGLRTVHVSAFEVEIASTESLLLSLDGKKFEDTVNISQASLDQVSYENHTNSWGGKGLVPMSSVGELDPIASRMKLFEKASLTASPGGYRLLASRVNNYQIDAEEQDGYVVFDLFVKNYSGNQYIPELNEFDEEAIYLTVDSAVTVDEAGGGVAGTGIENSVRVAFAQIGRVNEQEADSSDITGITCAPDSETGEPSIIGKVTGICRTASIWEPNDTSHVTGAISYYQTSCLTRNEDGEFSEDEKCALIEGGEYYPTFAVAKPIGSEHKVDVYDGTIYNGYGGKTLLPEPDLYNGFPSDFALEDEEDALLYAVPTFTDTMKVQTGTARRPFMYLAPNSVTKVRVYIYIEGQDVDNYDFAQIGKRISIKFGFTKERFTSEDLPYDGPGLDFEKPVIELNGGKEITITQGETYEELGGTVTDNKDTELSWSDVVVDGTVDTGTPGTYVIYYRVQDAAGNRQTAMRTVIVEE